MDAGDIRPLPKNTGSRDNGTSSIGITTSRFCTYIGPNVIQFGYFKKVLKGSFSLSECERLIEVHGRSIIILDIENYLRQSNHPTMIYSRLHQLTTNASLAICLIDANPSEPGEIRLAADAAVPDEMVIMPGRPEILADKGREADLIKRLVRKAFRVKLTEGTKI